VGNAYRTRLILRRGERIAPLAKPGASIAVADLLPVPESVRTRLCTGSPG
jgi:hypothetical protein